MPSSQLKATEKLAVLESVVSSLNSKLAIDVIIQSSEICMDYLKDMHQQINRQFEKLWTSDVWDVQDYSVENRLESLYVKIIDLGLQIARMRQKIVYKMAFNNKA